MIAAILTGLIFLSTYSTANGLWCRMGMSPVCAKFEKEYRLFENECAQFARKLMLEELWEAVPMGQCWKSICPIKCSRSGPRVCASYRGVVRQFPNKCDFLNFACLQISRGWAIEECQKT